MLYHIKQKNQFDETATRHEVCYATTEEQSGEEEKGAKQSAPKK